MTGMLGTVGNQTVGFSFVPAPRYKQVILLLLHLLLR